MITFRPLCLSLVCVLTLSLLVLPGVVQSIDSEGMHLVYGPGQRTCTEALAYPDLLTTDAANWVMGFLSAANLLTLETYALIGGLEAYNWVLAYCTKNPRHLLSDALFHLIIAAKPTRQQHADDVRLPPPQPAAPESMTRKRDKRS
jgi:hypothetical protein